MQKVTIKNITDVFKSKHETVDTAILKGYTLIEELFVDSSGFGSPSEPALTKGQFQTTLEKILQDYPTVYTAITSVGQFQVYIGIFHKDGVTPKRTKKLRGVATYEVQYDDGYAIRYHDTDVIRFFDEVQTRDGCDSNVSVQRIVLDNGGYETKTTKERINEYLPRGYYIQQKNYTWYLVKTESMVEVARTEWKHGAILDNITIK